MTQPAPSGGPSGSTTPCPWCSTAVSADAERCPNCGAALKDADGQPDIPGVTQVDPTLAARRELPKPNRLVGWLSGDVDIGPPAVAGLGTSSGGAGAGDGETIVAADPGSIAPPSAEVRREMARLELEALRAQMDASTGPAEPDAGAEPAAGTDPAANAEPIAESAAEAPAASDGRLAAETTSPTPGTEPTERGDGAVA